MKLIKVAAAALNQTPIHWENNLANIVSAIEQARSEDVSVLCLPELCITGYGCEDAFHSSGIRQSAIDTLKEVIPHTTGTVSYTHLTLPTILLV